MALRGWVGANPPHEPFTLNRLSPQARGLVAWYPYTNSTTNYAATRSDTRLTVPSTVSVVRSPVVGSVWSTPSGQNILAEETLFTSNLSYATISMWQSFNNSGARETGIWKSRTSTSDVTFAWRKDSGTDALRAFYYAGGEYSFTDGVGVSMGVLYHVAVTWDGTTCRLYKNGRQVASDATGSGGLAAATDDTYGLNCKSSGGSSARGTCADARVYNRALSAAEIWHLYNPDTRWDLYATTRIEMGLVSVAATGNPWYHRLQQRVNN